MHKPDFPRVQALTAEGKFFSFRVPVNRVARQGMPEIRHVHADLVGSARFQAQFHKSIADIGFERFVMGYGGFGILIGYRHFFAVARIPSDGRIYRTAVCFQTPCNDSAVFACKAVFGNLLGKHAVRKIVFCHD